MRSRLSTLPSPSRRTRHYKHKPAPGYLFLFIILAIGTSFTVISSPRAWSRTATKDALQRGLAVAVKSMKKGDRRAVEKILGLLVSASSNSDNVHAWRCRMLLAFVLEREKQTLVASGHYRYLAQTTYCLNDFCWYQHGLLLAEQDPSQAAQWLRSLPRHFPNSDFSAGARVRAAELFLDNGDYSDAIEVIATNDDETISEQRELLLARGKIGLDDLEGARRHLHFLLNERPFSKSASEAAGLLDILVEKNGPSYDLDPGQRMGRLRRFVEGQTYKAGLAEAERIVRYEGHEKLENEAFIFHYALCLYHRRQYDDARNYFDKLKARPTSVHRSQALGYLGRIAWQRNHPHEAEEYFSRLLTDFPRDNSTIELGRYLASNYKTAGEPTKALSFLKRLSLSNIEETDRAAFLWELAWLSMTTGDNRTATASLTNIVTNYPTSPEGRKAIYWLARLREESGEKRAAGELLEKILETETNDYYSVMAAHRYRSLHNMARGARIDLPNAIVKTNRGLDELRQLLDPPPGFPLENALAWKRSEEFARLAITHRAAAELERLRQRVKSGSPRLIFALAALYHEDVDYNNSIPLYRGLLRDMQARGQHITSTELERRIYPLAYHEIIVSEATKKELKPPFIAGVILQESSFNQMARSHSGAVGLMQIMTKVGRWLATREKIKNYHSSNLTDPAFNIRLGVALLHWLDRLFEQDQLLILAAYNAGRSNVLKWQAAYPGLDSERIVELVPFSETQNFVKQVIRNVDRYTMLYPELLIKPDQPEMK